MADRQEYLRRNLIHAKSVGIEAAARVAMDRLSTRKRPPKWLLEKFRAILDRAPGVRSELAAHRDEIEP